MHTHTCSRKRGRSRRYAGRERGRAMRGRRGTSTHALFILCTRTADTGRSAVVSGGGGFVFQRTITPNPAAVVTLHLTIRCADSNAFPRARLARVATSVQLVCFSRCACIRAASCSQAKRAHQEQQDRCEMRHGKISSHACRVVRIYVYMCVTAGRGGEPEWERIIGGVLDCMCVYEHV